ncbi:MAG TPA: DUF2721 domain-containing protein [Anaeromyxobacteraceae bacterium]|nr:DUF2721 domain-containing protein [Anaeromyxobacteraceae bacterium]
MKADALPLIASAVTPAVMVSACGLIALGLINLSQALSGRLRELSREHRAGPTTDARRAVVRQQVAILGRRHQTVTWALFLDYGAILAFTLTSLLFLGQGIVTFPATLAAVTFILGVVLLCGAAGFAIAAVHLDGGALRLERMDVLGGPGPRK